MELEDLLLKNKRNKVSDEEIKESIFEFYNKEYSIYYSAIRGMYIAMIATKYNKPCNNLEEILRDAIKKCTWIGFDINPDKDYYLTEENCKKIYDELRQEYPDIPEEMGEEFKYNKIMDIGTNLKKIKELSSDDNIKNICRIGEYLYDL